MFFEVGVDLCVHPVKKGRHTGLPLRNINALPFSHSASLQ
jgi:hypothetical protein